MSEQLRTANKRVDELNISVRNATELADAERLRAEELNVDRNDAALRLQVRFQFYLCFFVHIHHSVCDSSMRNMKLLQLD